jgi:hypothetical protein
LARAHGRYWQHPATSFVHRQSKLMKKGYSEEEAYNIVDGEDKQGKLQLQQA